MINSEEIKKIFEEKNIEVECKEEIESAEKQLRSYGTARVEFYKGSPLLLKMLIDYFESFGYITSKKTTEYGNTIINLDIK